MSKTYHVSYSPVEKDLEISYASPANTVSHRYLVQHGSGKLDQIVRRFQSVAALGSFAAEQDRGVLAFVQSFGVELYDMFFRHAEGLLAECTDLVVHQRDQMVPLELAFDGTSFL